MLVVDRQKCSACGACMDACPVEALSLTQQTLVIDYDNCIECGVCIAECPDDALSLDDRIPASIRIA